MYQAAVDAFGGVNIIYNNAGIGGREDNVRDCPEEVFDEIMAINLRGVWLGIKYGIPTTSNVPEAARSFPPPRSPASPDSPASRPTAPRRAE